MIRDIIRIIQGWREVWLTNDQTMFFKAKGALVDNGIKSRSKVVCHLNRQRGGYHQPRSNGASTYYLYVMAEDLYDAKNIY